jgi:hypothetical protein
MMQNLFSKALALLVGTPQPAIKPIKSRPFKSLTERELVQLESQVGAQLFGEIPKGHRRVFFNVDASSWIWHEEWIGATGNLEVLTTRYEIQPTGILRVRVGEQSVFVVGQELQNLSLATQMYYEGVMRDVYKRDPHTQKPLI